MERSFERSGSGETPLRELVFHLREKVLDKQFKERPDCSTNINEGQALYVLFVLRLVRRPRS